MKLTRSGMLLLVPGVAVLLMFIILPLLNVAENSFRDSTGGEAFGNPDKPYTLFNYSELMLPVYLQYTWEMIYISLISTTCGVLLAFPMAYFIARHPAGALRTFCIGFLVGFLFLSGLVRVYSLELTFGAVGLGPPLSKLFGISSHSHTYAAFMVVMGLMHHNIPLSALILIGTIQNVNPRLADAAQALGAPPMMTHVSITMPLSIHGLLSSFLINYMIAISAFVNPMVLGKGKVLFMSNLIYSRFGEAANFPSGAAIAVQLLILAFVMVYAIQALVPARWSKA